MTKRVQLKHVQIDHNFFQKPKIVALIHRYKAEGIMLFQMILCDMAQATDGEIDVDCIRARACSIGWDDAKADEFINYCLEREMIHRGSKSFLVTNRRIQADQESMALKQEKWRQDKRLQREPPKTNNGHLVDKKETELGPVKTEDLNYEDLNSEEGGSKGGTPPRAFPSTLDRPDCREIVDKWRLHLHKNHKKRFDELAEDALLMSYGGRPLELIADIAWSIQNGWKSIQIKPKDIPKPSYSNKPQQQQPSRAQVPDAGKTKAMLDKIFNAARPTLAVHQGRGQVELSNVKKNSI